MPNEFFSYSEDGAEFHDTAEQAKAEVERRLNDYRDDAPEGWAEEVELLCWGEVKGRVEVTARRERCPDADCNGECGDDVHHSRSYDVEVDYELVGLDKELPALRAEVAEGQVERVKRAAISEKGPFLDRSEPPENANYNCGKWDAARAILAALEVPNV